MKIVNRKIQFNEKEIKALNQAAKIMRQAATIKKGIDGGQFNDFMTVGEQLTEMAQLAEFNNETEA